MTRKLMRRSAGFSLLELMVSLAISLVVVLALATLFQNTSRNNAAMATTGDLVESGRAAVSLMADDLQHGGFWGGYMPAYEDLSHDVAPGDLPIAIPNPCAPVADWDTAYYFQMLGMPLQTSDSLPTGAGCLGALTARAGSDIVVVRHAETCAVGDPNCEALVAGEMYVQASRCANELDGGAGNASTSSTIVLESSASDDDGAYVGTIVRLLRGQGAGQARRIIAYDGDTRTATVSPDWDAAIGQPAAGTAYALAGHIGTSGFPLTLRDCTTAATPTPAPRFKVVSHLYYVSDITRDGVTTPTLVRSRLERTAGGLAHQPPVELVPGVEAIRLHLGVDDTTKDGVIVDDAAQAAAVQWESGDELYNALNRADGQPDRYLRCTAATPCTALELRNVVAARLFVLARARETTNGYTDTKSFCLGDPEADGTCAAANSLPAANDSIKRHVFSTGIRLPNVSGRRETP